MHDCVKTRGLLVDLVFDELVAEARRRALLDLEDCPDCMAQYHSMMEAMRLFDEAAKITIPEESYWPGYEIRLRERLRQNSSSIWTGWLARLKGNFGSLTPPPTPVVVVGIALVLLAIGWWTFPRREAPVLSGDPYLATKTPAPQREGKPQGEVNAITPKPGSFSTRATRVRPTIHPAVHSPAIHMNGEAQPAFEPGFEIDENIVSAQSQVAFSLFTPETISHFEKAQLMLRSFCNESASKTSPASDLAYERQSSRRLLYQNILLRRDAEMKGNLPAEEALSNLEPFLLDIANLPDNPPPSELRRIRDHLRRKELIASLQIDSALPRASANRIP